jgi:hypothetical protein
MFDNRAQAGQAVLPAFDIAVFLPALRRTLLRWHRRTSSASVTAPFASRHCQRRAIAARKFGDVLSSIGCGRTGIDLHQVISYF